MSLPFDTSLEGKKIFLIDKVPISVVSPFWRAFSVGTRAASALSLSRPLPSSLRRLSFSALAMIALLRFSSREMRSSISLSNSTVSR